jgi:hypothetical protein
MPDLRRIRAQLRGFAESTAGRLFLKGLRVAVIGGIVGYLVYQLTQMGWGAFWQSLPATPWFYVTVLAMYVTLPISEVLIYGRIWGLSPGQSLPLLMRKRVLNADVVGYSGEFFLLAHARKRIDRPARALASEIKDNLILSSVASISVAVFVLVVLLASGYVAMEELIGNATPGYVAVGGFAFVLIAGLFVRFRRTLFALGTRTLGFILGVHLARFLLSSVLQVAQWWVVLPDAPFSVWATLLVIFVVMNRIPFLPSRDLAFAGVGIEASAALGVPGPAVAGMLLTRSVIDRVLNVGFFTVLSVRDREGLFELETDAVPDDAFAADAPDEAAASETTASETTASETTADEAASRRAPNDAPSSADTPA